MRGRRSVVVVVVDVVVVGGVRTTQATTRTHAACDRARGIPVGAILAHVITARVGLARNVVAIFFRVTLLVPVRVVLAAPAPVVVVVVIPVVVIPSIIITPDWAQKVEIVRRLGGTGCSGQILAVVDAKH